MYEAFFGLNEKPFSITPDPKFFFQSDSHRGALDLLRHGVHNKDGFMVITGDIGTGKTTLCRALLEGLDQRYSTALILNPFLSEDDLLKVILQDFGVLSKEEKRELAGASKQDLIELLNQFLLNTLSIGGSALLIIDEAQNLPLPTLEQIRILSNLETHKEKLLQIILVGQLGLIDVLRSNQLRQLDQRIACRYQIGPLEQSEIPRYIAHRLMIAGSRGNIQFHADALQLIYQYSMGFPRIINLLCDRSLLGGFTARSHVINKEMVKKAAQTMDLGGTAKNYAYKINKKESFWFRYRRGLVVGLAFVVMIFATLIFWSQITAAVSTVWPVRDIAGNEPEGGKTTPVKSTPSGIPGTQETRKDGSPPTGDMGRKQTSAKTFQDRQFSPSAGYPYTLHLGSFQEESPVRKLMGKLDSLGYRSYVATVDLGDKGTWHRLLVGRFKSQNDAGRMAEEIKEYGDFSYVKVISADRALAQ